MYRQTTVFHLLSDCLLFVRNVHVLTVRIMKGIIHLEFDSLVPEKPPRDRNIFAFKISNHLKDENISAIKVHPSVALCGS